MRVSIPAFEQIVQVIFSEQLLIALKPVFPSIVFPSIVFPQFDLFC